MTVRDVRTTSLVGGSPRRSISLISLYQDIKNKNKKTKSANPWKLRISGVGGCGRLRKMSFENQGGVGGNSIESG